MDSVFGNNNVFSITGIDENNRPYCLFRATVSPWKYLTPDSPGAAVPEGAKEGSIICVKINVGQDGVAKVGRTSLDGKIFYPVICAKESATEITKTLHTMREKMKQEDYPKQAPVIPEVVFYKDPRRETLIVSLS